MSCSTRHRVVPETISTVVIDHPCRLHEGIANGRAHKLKASFAQVSAHRIRFFIGGWYLCLGLELMFDGLTAGKLPDIIMKGSELGLDLDKFFCIDDRCLDLQSITDDPWIVEETLYVLVAIVCNNCWIKSLKGLAEVCALSKHRHPCEPCLCALQDQ